MSVRIVKGTLAGLLLLAGAQATGAQEVPIPAEPKPFEALAQQLTVAAWDQRAPGCSIEVTGITGSRKESCATGDVEGSTTAGSHEASLTEVARVDTTRWFPDILARSDESFVRVHGYGDAAAVAPDGTILWRRSAASFYEDWGLTPYIVPVVAIGTSPLNPQTIASETAWSVGDVTGDGVEDVAIGHLVTTEEVDEGGAPYEYLRSFVTLLDGVDGQTLWHRTFPRYVTHALLTDGLLLVGNETGERTGTAFQTGEAGSRTSVHAFRVTSSGDGVDVDPAWTFDTGIERERLLAMQAIGDDGVAVARPSGVSMFEAATGEMRWTVPTSGDPRLLRYDEVRDLVVVQELRPVVDGIYSYALKGLRASDGEQALEVVRPAAILLSLDVADVTGTAGPEWIVGDLLQIEEKPSTVLAGTYAAGRVETLNPENGTALWSHRVDMGQDLLAGRTGGTSVPYFYGVQAVGDVVAAGWLGIGAYGLAGLDGDSGAMLWEEYSPDGSYPVFLERSRIDGEPALLSSTAFHLVRAHAADDGTVLTEAPALAEILAVADVDSNGDGVTDIIAGSESGGVFALDGQDLDRILWQTTASGPVHQLHASDLDGDGTPELVAAAHRGVDVLRLDGSTAYTIPRPAPDVVWTVTLGDLDGDGRDDLVVPARSLSAWRGTNGSQLWEFLPPTDERVETRFSTSVVTPERRVVSQFLKRAWAGANPVNPRGEHHLVGLDGATGDVEWLRPDADVIGIPRLWQSVTVVPGEGSGAAAVAVTWDEQSGTGTGLWRPTTDVIDSATGNVIRSATAGQSVVHMGTEFIPPYGLVGFNWTGVARLAPQAVVETAFGGSVWDLAVADAGDEEVLVRGRGGVHLYDVALPFSGGDAGQPLASWTDLFVGRIHPSDLDGDGRDELISHGFDWPTYIEVGLWEGTGTTQIDYFFHGLAVLELS